jgi:hypothetical protein
MDRRLLLATGLLLATAGATAFAQTAPATGCTAGCGPRRSDASGTTGARARGDHRICEQCSQRLRP